MKKVLFAITAVLGLGLALATMGCGGGSDEEEVATTPSGSGQRPIPSVIVDNEINGSEVFITGRTVELYLRWACDHEVTQAEYEQYCNYGEYSPNSMFGVGSDYPVYHISWYDALVYCNRRSMAEGLNPCYTINGSTNPDEWGTVPTSINATWDAVTCNWNANGYRLPTEAEWEYLARGSNTSIEGQTTYSGSDTIGNVAWYCENAFNMGFGNEGFGTHVIKTRESNSLGLYDMSGNVDEWCWDWYDDITASTPSTGASSGSHRVSRGGCFGSSAEACSVASRLDCSPDFGSGDTGIRVVRSAD